jgi:hypothetical protein
MKNKDLEKEKIEYANTKNLESAEACIISAQQSFEDNKIEDAMYWLNLAGVYCKLIISRRRDNALWG